MLTSWLSTISLRPCYRSLPWIMTLMLVVFSLVSRISARSEQFDMLMHLDINTEIYPMRAGEKFMMVLASTLNLDGTPDSGYYTPVKES